MQQTTDSNGWAVFDDGVLSIDLTSRRIARNGDQVRLTPKEFAVLQVLRNRALVTGL